MLRVDLQDVKPGMVLALPVRNPRDVGKVLLRVGYALNPTTIARLFEFEVNHVWVRYPDLDVLCHFLNVDVISAQAVVVQRLTESFSKLQERVNAKLPYNQYRRSIRDLIHHLVRHPQAGIFLGEMTDAGRGDLMSHSSRVAYLSLLMGLKLEGYLVRQRRRIHPVVAKEVTALGLGAMLHDVGVTALPKEVYERFLKTGDDTDPEWREHPALGYKNTRGQIEPSATTVILNHHQRYDGSGYAGKGNPILEGDRVHVFSRIVALADHFDRMAYPPHRPAQPVVAALRDLLRDDVHGKFDPHVMRALLLVVPPYPPGSRVLLSDGRRAMCIDHTPADPCRPTVQVFEDVKEGDTSEINLGEILNLHECNDGLFISECEGQPVGDLNFPSPALIRNSAQGVILKRRGKVGLL